MIELETSTLFWAALALVALGAVLLFAALAFFAARFVWQLVAGPVTESLGAAARNRVDGWLHPVPLRRHAANGTAHDTDPPTVDVTGFEDEETRA